MIATLLERTESTQYRSLENPSTPLSNADEWLYDAFGATKSQTGLRIGRKEAMSVGAFFKGVNTISRDVAKIPIPVYRRLQPQGKEVVRQHPGHQLLNKRASRRVNAFNFKLTMQSHAMTHGNGYAAIGRNSDGKPMDLLILDPTATYPILVNADLRYITTIGNGAESEILRLDPDDVFHVRGLGFDGLVGYDIITLAKESLGLEIATRTFSAKFFVNGAHGYVTITHPNTLSDKAKKWLQEHWEKTQTGLSNAHKTIILEEGMTVNQLTVDARRAQLLELRKFEIREIANFLLLPPHKLGDPQRTSYNSLEQENHSYLSESLDGWLCQWESEANDKLLTEAERQADTHFFEFKREAIIRVDMKTKVESLVTELNNGGLTLNEYRAVQNRPPAPNGIGDGFRIPSNITLLDKVMAEDPDDPDDDPDRDDDDDEDRDQDQDGELEDKLKRADMALYWDALARVSRRIAVQARRAAKKPDDFGVWIEKLEAVHGRYFDESMMPIVLCETLRDGRDTGIVTKQRRKTYFDCLTESLLRACECKPDELAESVDRTMGNFVGFPQIELEEGR